MTDRNKGKVPEGMYANKGICTDSTCIYKEIPHTATNSESGSCQTPSKLKQEVQTIIDIMGPPIKPFSTCNTSSEADNEESIFTNSKVSTTPKFRNCECDMDFFEKTEEGVTSKDETNMSVISAAADNNTSRISDVEALPSDQHCHYQMMDTSYAPQYICPPPLLPANICINSECLCPQMASMLHTSGMATLPHNGMMPGVSQHGILAPRASGGAGISCEGMRRSRKDNVDTHQVPDYEMYTNTDATLNKKRGSMLGWIKSKLESLQPNSYAPCRENGNCEDYYKMNIKRSRKDDKSPPRRVVFELVPSGIPKGTPCEPCALKSDPKCAQKFYFRAKGSKSEPAYIDRTYFQEEDLQKTPGKEDDFQGIEEINACQASNQCCESININNVRKSVGRTTYFDPTGNTRVDVYYFDHGNSTHFKTTDSPPIVTTEELSERIERKATRYWAEMFGSAHIVISFITSFILQLFRFLMYSILRPLTIGVLQLASDYLFKPLLATLFNGILQPILIFFYNIATSIRDLLDPLAEGVGYFFKELAVLVGSFRLFQKVDNGSCGETLDSKCGKNSKKASKKCSCKAANC